MKMNKRSQILMVGSGENVSRRDHMKREEKRVENAYFNYSLLGLATKLEEDGYSNIKMFAGETTPVADIIQRIESSGINIDALEYPLLLSIPSFHSLDWAKEFVKTIKNINSKTKIVAGLGFC